MNRYKILSALAAMTLAAPLTAPAEAAYSADSDTGVEALDYIENRHRVERENRLTDEQKALVADAKKMRESLRYPVDPTKAMPMTFEGDDLTYDESTGEFIARGNVKILQADAHSFAGSEITGNTVTQEIHSTTETRVLQMTEGEMPIILDGYRMNYSYSKQTGDMEDVKGKAGTRYITGKRFEFYPDHYVAYEGTLTKCGAKHSDYHWGAEKITVYPNDKAILEKAGFYIKGKKIYGRDRYVDNISPTATSPQIPRIDYDSSKGVSVTYPLNIDVAKNVAFKSDLEINKKYGWRSHYQLGYSIDGFSTGVRYGYYEDSDNEWIRREPSGYMGYTHALGHTGFNYSLNTEYGRWYGITNHIHSNHWYYGVTLNHNPIVMGKYTLRFGGGYGVTRESYSDSKNHGFNYGAVLTGDFNERWAAYVGYHYTYENEHNALFNYDTDDFSKKLEGGFSYRFDDLNRVALGTRYDLDHSKWNDIDYYWYHDMHCAQLVTRYRSMKNHWSVRLQFTPW